jgi:hypothetical protein
MNRLLNCHDKILARHDIVGVDLISPWNNGSI